MGNDELVERIRPFASFKAITLLLIASGVLWLINWGLQYASSAVTVAATTTCSIASEMTVNEVHLQATAICGGVEYPFDHNLAQLLFIANLSPEKRSTGTFTCDLYVSGNAACDFPTK